MLKRNVVNHHKGIQRILQDQNKKIARRVRSNERKVVLITFFDFREMVHRERILQGQACCRSSKVSFAFSLSLKRNSPHD